MKQSGTTGSHKLEIALRQVRKKRVPSRSYPSTEDIFRRNPPGMSQGVIALLELNDHISNLIIAGLEKSNGAPLASYPQLTWPFDTMPCLISVVDWGKEEARVSAVKQAHLKWLDGAGLNEEFKLPYSEMPGSRPRGCDLSLRIAFIKKLDSTMAAKYYDRYRTLFWLDRGAMAGFAEWPEGKNGAIDIDSGAVIDGIGMAATGNGIAVARAMNDQEVLKRLMGELQLRDAMAAIAALDSGKGWINEAFKSMGLTFNSHYFTGFLFGDAILFGVITWPQG